jgi:flagellar motor protein MotB
VVGNRTAWEAYASLGRKLAGKANKSAVLALVKIEPEQGSSKGQASSSSREGKAAAEQQQEQQLTQQAEAEGSQQQQQQQGQSGKQQQQKGAGYRLSMLIVHDEDVQRSIMQVGGWVALTLLGVPYSVDCADDGSKVVLELCSVQQEIRKNSVCVL